MQRRHVLGLLAAAPFAMTVAQAIEVIDLRFRTADQLLPVLQPLVEPGGALSGQGSQLFLRTSGANAAQIRQVLATLDRPPRQLQIRVRQDLAQEGSSQQRSVDGSVTTTSRRTYGTARIETRDGTSTATRGAEQTLRVLEGGRAYVVTGTSIPFTFRHWVRGPGGSWTATQQTTYYDALSGFYVQPQVAGNLVTLDIAPEDAQVTASGIDRARLSTQVQARLGEWTPLGGADVRSETAGGGSTAPSASQRGVWVLVEDVTGAR
jgi:hypothetical protein